MQRRLIPVELPREIAPVLRERPYDMPIGTEGMTKAEKAVMAWLEWDRSMTKHGNTGDTQRLYRKCLALSMDVKDDLDPEIADAHNNHEQDDPEWMTAQHYCGEGQLVDRDGDDGVEAHEEWKRRKIAERSEY